MSRAKAVPIGRRFSVIACVTCGSAGQHVADTARVIGLPRRADVTKDGQLSSNGSQAAPLAGLGIAPSQSAGLDHNRLGNGFAAFAAAILSALGFSRVPELGD